MIASTVGFAGLVLWPPAVCGSGTPSDMDDIFAFHILSSNFFNHFELISTLAAIISCGRNCHGWTQHCVKNHTVGFFFALSLLSLNFLCCLFILLLWYIVRSCSLFLFLNWKAHDLSWGRKLLKTSCFFHTTKWKLMSHVTVLNKCKWKKSFFQGEKLLIKKNSWQQNELRKLARHKFRVNHELLYLQSGRSSWQPSQKAAPCTGIALVSVVVEQPFLQETTPQRTITSSFTDGHLKQVFKHSETCLCITLLAKPENAFSCVKVNDWESAVQEVPLHWTFLHGLAAEMHFVLIQIHSPLWSPGFTHLYKPFCKKINNTWCLFIP